MHTIKITPNLLFEYQCTSGKFIRLSNRNFFCPNWNALLATHSACLSVGECVVTADKKNNNSAAIRSGGLATHSTCLSAGECVVTADKKNNNSAIRSGGLATHNTCLSAGACVAMWSRALSVSSGQAATDSDCRRGQLSTS